MDMTILRALEGARTPFFDAAFEFITRFGEETIAIVALCLVFWCLDKRLGYIVGVGFFSSGVVVQLMKVIFRVERPWVKYSDFTAVEGAIAHATGYSFPSGHTQTAVAVYGSLGLNVKSKKLAAACIAVALLVGFSRMYLGVHYPSDVAVALAITAAFCFAARALFKNYETAKSFDVAVSLALLLAAAGVLVFAASMFSSAAIERKYVSDCCKNAGAVLGFAAGFYIERKYVSFDVRCDKLWKQAVKLLLGLAVLVAIKSGLKLVIGESLFADTFRYFLTVLWVIAIYPMAIKRFFSLSKTGEA